LTTHVRCDILIEARDSLMQIGDATMADDLGPILPMPGEENTQTEESTIEKAASSEVAGAAETTRDTAEEAATAAEGADPESDAGADPLRGQGTIREMPEGGPPPGP
jgi:hypothetical protein